MVARLLRRQPHVRVGCTAVLTPPGSSGFPSRAGDSTNRQTPLRRRDLRIRVGDGPWVTCTTSPISIGRDPNVTIVIDDDRVSRRHAELRWTNSGWRLIDVGSRNGTWRDGRRSAEEAVASALQVRLGDPLDGTELTVRTVVRTDGEPGQRVMTVGRDSGNELVVDDPLVSRWHCGLVETAKGLVLTDLGSSNGTHLNGALVPPNGVSVVPGDVVTIGSHQLDVDGERLRLQPGVALLIARNLDVVTDDGTRLLDGVSVDVAPGEFVAVIGPSGAGKSTLLNALTGFRPASTGTVEVGGRSLYQQYDALRASIGYVPQQDILHAQLSVRAALEYAAELRFAADVTSQERNARVQQVLGELGLSSVADRSVAQLSGGQRKRVNVALELLTKPPLLFLDEPTSGLDPGHERSLMESLRQLAHGKRSVIVVTHNVANLHLCDRLLVLAPGGHAVLVASPAEVLRRSGQADFTNVFIELEQGTFPAETRHSRPAETRHSRPAETLPGARGPSFARSLRVLTRRYTRIVTADRRNLAILLLQAPLLGLLTRAMMSPAGLAADPGSPNSAARRVLLMLVLSATWVGASNAVREIVKERPIYRRERSIGVPIGAYLLSKMAVLAPLTFAQSLVLVAVATAGHRAPAAGAGLSSASFELVVDVAAAGIAAMALGLLLSATVSSADKALSLLPLLLVPQLVLSGGLLSVEKTPALRVPSYAASARYGFAAAAATVDLGRLEEAPPPPPGVPASPRIAQDAEWPHDPATWTTNVLGLLALTVLCCGGAYLALRRSEPGRR